MRAAAEAGIRPGEGAVKSYLLIRWEVKWVRPRESIFISSSVRRTSDHAECVRGIDFVHSSGGSVASSLFLLLDNIARTGNYTAFLGVLYHATTREANTTLPPLVVSWFVNVIRAATRSSCEDLEGYPATRLFAADMRLYAPDSTDLLERADDSAAALYCSPSCITDTRAWQSCFRYVACGAGFSPQPALPEPLVRRAHERRFLAR
ncbi:hypothetical protein DFJ74DRAFT_501545 [Hyaloraphidium curvatum]|nr:hypothetical protein DFJ74DRAFT_501545 [Hyaloraphidium curvatum]